MLKTKKIIVNALTMIVVFISSATFAEGNTFTKASSINEAEPFALSNILQMLAGLSFVVILILLLGWFYRRFGTPRAGNSGDFRIVAGISMGQRERVVMLQVGDRQILLGVGPGHVEKIHVFDEPVINVTTPSGVDSFADRLASVIKHRGQN